MRTLHAYVTRQVVATLLMTVLVFTFVLLLGNVLKEILTFLINGQATLLHAGQAVVLLIPFVLVFALPMGLLTATLLVFGRFSADQELTAMRASGVSLVALITPVLLLSVAMSGVSALINMRVAPQCRVAYLRLLDTVVLSRTDLVLPEKTFIYEFPRRIVYIDEIEGPQLKNILIYNLDSDGKVGSYVRASDGHVQFDRATQVIQVQLLDAWSVTLGESNQIPVTAYAAESLITYTNKAEARKERSTKITDMTFAQLQNELREMEKRILSPAPLAKVPRDQRQAKWREMQQQRGDLTLPIRVQMHRQIAFAFASIAFTLVGIPLGIRTHRRETTFGIAMALILAVAYFSFCILGQSLDNRPDCYPHLLLWAPNFLFQAIGVVLLWRANRGI